MSDTEQYWYNLTTKQVERGFESPAVDRAGPFATAEEAAKAPELLAERSRAWAADDAADDNWGTPAKGSSGDASDR
ncbi:SPOR domain-containing protein [Microbacterium dauci]|uniref:SPOR domain-containing protein n=1 Tax=Microbacterium dauci TaxID=3048008 RepID=A0ABT6ZGV0_9MICO|nr:SPOR domain-containing protein [Microbacterium sp. LX3-4]MDJ1115370.1 SPOR domain-containing protein [Microbacterium sp. LX3-4]